MADTLEIVRGISQAIANRHDGALDEDGEPVKIGLRREEGMDLTDRRVMDGFNVSLYGDMMCIKYHGEATLKEVHNKDFESDMEQMVQDISSYIKKEYRKVTKSSLNLVKEGEIDILVQSLNRGRSWIQAKCDFKIGNYSEVDTVQNETEDKKLDKDFKNFIEAGGFEKKAKNDKRPAPEKTS